MIVGHQKQFELLRQSAAAGKLSHAYIFSGPAQVGKKALAFAWLSELFGRPVAENIANPDFSFVALAVDPKTGEPNKEIEIKQIRGLIDKLSLKPIISPIKAAIIDNAHLMNAEAQNCLLKTLEEPSGNAVIILIAENSRRLLPTIVSRCEIVTFNFVPQAELEKFANGAQCKNIDSARFSELLKLSQGRPGRLINFIACPDGIERLQKAAKAFGRVISAPLAERFAYAKEVAETANFSELIEIWQVHFRNLLLEALSQPKSTESGTRQDLPSPGLGEAKPQFVFSKTKAPAYPLEKVTDILKKIHELNVVLQTTNVNSRLAIENFMLNI